MNQDYCMIFNIKKESNDGKRLLKAMVRFFDFILIMIGMNNVEEFCSDLKNHTLYDKKRKESKKDHFKKEDAFPLLDHLFKICEPGFLIPKRELKRAGYFFKDIMLTYFAFFYPSAMLNVSKNLHMFDFYHKLHDVDTLKFKWEQKIKRIQEIYEKKHPTQNVFTPNFYPPDQISQNFNQYDCLESSACYVDTEKIPENEMIDNQELDLFNNSDDNYFDEDNFDFNF